MNSEPAHSRYGPNQETTQEEGVSAGESSSRLQKLRAWWVTIPWPEADRLYPFLLLCCLVFIVVVPWHAVNQHLPIWDSADFVLNAQNILQRMQANLLDGIEALYLARGWRPLIFPALTVPFFWMADGRILAGVGLAQYFTAILLATYLYLFFRQTLPSQRALLATLLIVSLKWVVGFTSAFYAELFWIAAGAGVLYHLSHALLARSAAHFVVAGCWLGLMGALRPVETVVLGTLPVVALILSEWHHGRVRLSELAWFTVQFLGVAAAVGLLALPDRGRVLAGVLLCAAVLIIGWRARRVFSDSTVLGFVVSAEAVALAWHLPTIRLLYFWAYDTSFGPLAKLTDQKFLSAPPWTIFWRLLDHYSPWILGALFVAALVGATQRLFDARDKCVRQVGIAMIAAFLMILPMLLIMSQSGTSDMRRVMPVMLVLFSGLLVMALNPAGLLSRTRFAVVGLLAGMQFLCAAATGLNMNANLLVKAQEFTGYYRRPDLGPDPNIPVLDGALGLGISRGQIAAYTYCYRDYANCERLGVAMFEPVALSTLAQERRLPIRVHFIGDLDFSKPATLSAQIRARGFNYVLVDMFDSPAKVNWADPYVQHTKAFVALARGPMPVGLVSRGCFPVVKRSICIIEATGDGGRPDDRRP
jgi:hypothetical protein